MTDRPDPRLSDALAESFYSDTDLIGLGDAVDGLAPGDNIFGAMADAIAATEPGASLLADAEGGRASEHDMKQRLQRVLDDYTDAQRAGWSASDYAYAMAAAPGDDDE
ncbi:MAG: hypothetical protein DRH30_00610 [Deltaproteobacteria bacterium]|nr:MAG: hypothetical protein DRH30_00610 [Deltaproteobacteria bacterium]